MDEWPAMTRGARCNASVWPHFIVRLPAATRLGDQSEAYPLGGPQPRCHYGMHHAGPHSWGEAKQTFRTMWFRPPGGSWVAERVGPEFRRVGFVVKEADDG